MRYYLKNYNKIFEKNLNDMVSKEIFLELKKFIKDKKHALGYIDEKFDDFVLLVFPTRYDIIHFEIDYKMKKAVYGVVIKTEEGYELISENIDDKNTHLDFIKTPAPPVTVIQLEENFKNYYLENPFVEELFTIIGMALMELDF